MKTALAALCCWIGVAPALGAADAEPVAIERFGDCGVVSLYLMLKTAGAGVDFQSLTNALPPPRQGGFSLGELRDASSKLGLRLVGARHPANDKRLDRPAITLMAYEGGPHYVLLKPVGSETTIVQVLDPPFAPKFIPLDLLSANPAWTGLTLQPMGFVEEAYVRSSAARPFFLTLGTASLIGLYVARRVGRSRNSRRPRTDAAVLGQG